MERNLSANSPFAIRVAIHASGVAAVTHNFIAVSGQALPPRGRDPSFSAPLPQPSPSSRVCPIFCCWFP